MARKTKKTSSPMFAAVLRRFFTKGEKKGKRGGRRRFFRTSLLTLLLLFSGGIFYLFQPPEIKEEVRYLSQVYWSSGRSVSLDEFAWDLWNLYFARDIIASDYNVPEESPVYGGIPREDSSQGRRFLRVLRNRGYWVGYDEKLRNPAWVAYRLFVVPDDIETPPRPSSFFTDDRTVAKVGSEDYTGSGFDRGHMAPNYAIARCYGQEAQKETFLMSNIVPQRHALNAGAWKKLETREANNYATRFREVWVLTGPIFRTQMAKTLPSGIPIPDAFYKIYLDEMNDKVRATAFVFEQDDDGSGALEKRLCSIAEIEYLTGLDFFPELHAEVQRQLESEKAAKAW